MRIDNCYRRISDITAQELKDLIGHQEENQWIEFKRTEYYRDPNDRERHEREICKDVTAIANAEGGYILIGVQETNGVAQGFFTVNNFNRIVESINNICLQSIGPRIQNLEVMPRSFEWNGRDITLVIIHIPPSEMHPHGFRWKGSTNFVKRYGAHIREYPISELAEAFSIRHYPPIIGQLNDKLDTILRHTRQSRRSSMSSQEDALEQQEIGDLLHLMKLRFEEAISEEPYYRILAVPTTLNPDTVSTQEQDIRAILRNPPTVRYSGFGVRGVTDILPSPEGIYSTNTWSDQELILLRNGFLELRSPLSSAHFQWFRIERGFSDYLGWLYPYAVCEYPVTFVMLVKAIYSAAGIDSSIFVQQEYHNLSGFLLVEGHPANALFGQFEHHRHVYERTDPIVSKQTVSSDLVPDQVAYNLAKEVYTYFQIGSVPLFDAEHNFTP